MPIERPPLFRLGEEQAFNAYQKEFAPLYLSGRGTFRYHSPILFPQQRPAVIVFAASVRGRPGSKAVRFPGPRLPDCFASAGKVSADGQLSALIIAQSAHNLEKVQAPGRAAITNNSSVVIGVSCTTGQRRVLRGGSWNLTNEELFRCAYRSYLGPAVRADYVGFRCVVPADK